MIHSKSRNNNNSQGFSFVEIMIAIALLGIFGSSLFLVQTNLVGRIISTHRAIGASNDVTLALFNFSSKLQQALLSKESTDKLSTSVTLDNPTRTITTTLKPLNEKSALYQTFHKRIRLIETKITQDTYVDTWYNFEFLTPENPVQAKKSTSPSNTTQGT